MKLISIHIPRCGGTSLLKIFQYIYGEDGVVRDSYLSELYPETTNKSQVIHGHFWHSRWNSVFPNVPKVTFLRNPVDRIVSVYMFWKKANRIGANIDCAKVKDGSLSFEEFLTRPESCNLITRTLIPVNSLDEFEFVGLMEEFEDGLLALNDKLLHANSFFIPHLNSYPSHIVLDKGLRRKVEELNSDDMELYEKAKEIWEKGYEAC